MQPEQQKLTAKAGWVEVKQEEIEKYAGDYIVSTRKVNLHQDMNQQTCGRI